MDYEDELSKIIYEKLTQQKKTCYTDEAVSVLQEAAAKVWNSYPPEQQEEIQKRYREFVVDVLGYDPYL